MRYDGSFQADDEDGNVHTIHIHTEELNASTAQQRGRKDDGLKHLKTDDGKPVRRVRQGEYEIKGIRSVVKLTSDDPDAP